MRVVMCRKGTTLPAKVGKSGAESGPLSSELHGGHGEYERLK